jgi:hypothetical protein
MRRGVQLLAAILLVILAACSLAIETADIDEGCAAGEKLCAGKCVQIADPAYGCTPTTCDKACLLTNAIPKCENGACVVRACLEGFGCPVTRSGCHVNVFVDRNNCGECDARCAEGGSCRGGVCVQDGDAG